MSRRQEKKAPIRTCLGCGKKAEKQHFARLVAVNGQIAVDSQCRIAGRGAYCCRQEKCFRVLLKKERKLARALRCESLRWPDDRTSLMNNVIKTEL
ncbi:MAG: YlxR family protein [Thermodesulfobacteriota bacterium]